MRRLLHALLALLSRPYSGPQILLDWGARIRIPEVHARGERGTSIRVTYHPVMPPAGGEMAVWSPDG